jgi:ribonucleoside-diphosphate reductase alpha chain
MRHAKTGQWWETAPHMALSNNSVVYTDKPDSETFLREWTSLVESKSGERGIFNRISAQYQAKKNGRRDPEHAFGTNPCSEIILRPYQFCNLTEVVVRKDDTRKSLQRKIAIATILGTMQSKLTNFPYLRKIWKNNTEEERLLGVSLTGIMDSPLTNGREMGLRERLEVFRKVAVDTNKKYADLLNIPPSTAITCVKPSGTVSQLCDSASGIHARHSQYYIRTVRGDNKDPLTKFMIDQGVPNEPEVNKPMDTTVFSFPIKSPEGSVTRNQMSAIEQLEMWRTYQEHWCEHKPSITVSVREDEWLEVGAFVFKYFTEMSGVSFLPHSDHVYQQAPYQECSEKEYNDMLSKMPTKIKWADLKEQTDTTAGSQSLACSGDSCELVDIGA